MDSYWNSELIPEHRRGICDSDWAALQEKGAPKFKLGDVVEFKDGGYGIIKSVCDGVSNNPPMYATRSIPGLPGYWKCAWHYEGDFKRLVTGSPLRDLKLEDAIV